MQTDCYKFQCNTFIKQIHLSNKNVQLFNVNEFYYFETFPSFSCLGCILKATKIFYHTLYANSIMYLYILAYKNDLNSRTL